MALYYAYLASYTRALVFPAALGIYSFYFSSPYNPVYSILILLWSIIFIEYWTLRERILSTQWGTLGSFKVEKRRAQYKQNGVDQEMKWWQKEARMLASVPVITFFAAILTCLLTGIFVFEAFVTQLYDGPGKQFVSFSPTIIFIALVPRLLSVYHAAALGSTLR